MDRRSCNTPNKDSDALASSNRTFGRLSPVRERQQSASPGSRILPEISVWHGHFGPCTSPARTRIPGRPRDGNELPRSAWAISRTPETHQRNRKRRIPFTVSGTPVEFGRKFLLGARPRIGRNRLRSSSARRIRSASGSASAALSGESRQSWKPPQFSGWVFVIIPKGCAGRGQGAVFRTPADTTVAAMRSAPTSRSASSRRKRTRQRLVSIPPGRARPLPSFDAGSASTTENCCA